MKTTEKTNGTDWISIKKIKDSIADDYIEVCLENERGFYEYVKKDNFSFDIILSGVGLWSDYLANYLFKYHDIKANYATINSLFTQRDLYTAAEQIYIDYQEEREELKS